MAAVAHGGRRRSPSCIFRPWRPIVRRLFLSFAVFFSTSSSRDVAFTVVVHRRRSPSSRDGGRGDVARSPS